MTNYDFKSLSPVEFENLIRDLLQKRENIVFESFKTGKDGGIDFRHSKAVDNEVVVQAKHYASSTFSRLYVELKKEYEKVIVLSPKRYIVVTSLPINPADKKKIIELFNGCINSTLDIVGPDDLNNYLSLYPDVEKSNFKLWLASAGMLELIVNSGIYRYSKHEVDLIEDKLCRYVKSAAFNIAYDLLADKGYCIIAGIPGIGKTTLAEILLIHYLDDGYQVFSISEDIDEAFSVYDPSLKQIFYYDDFLGQTGLDDKLRKNEDSRLVRFCEMVNKSENVKFIMTTREYILNQAKSVYEKLASSDIDINTCVVDLSSYASIDKAMILYNHLSFSDLSADFILEVKNDKSYLKIINHKSFNPRVVEWMTSKAKSSGIESSSYIKAFLDRLNNPALIWQHAFDCQISECSRQLLIAMITVSDIVDFDTVKKIFTSYLKEIGKEVLFSDLKKSLKELEGNFLTITRSDNELMISYHNPSIRDFITHLLSNDILYTRGLVKSCIYYDQFVTFSNAFQFSKVSPFVDEIIVKGWGTGIINSLDTCSINYSHSSTFNGVRQYSKSSKSMIQRLGFILSSSHFDGNNELNKILSDRIELCVDGFYKLYDWDDAEALIMSISFHGEGYGLEVSKLVEKSVSSLINNLTQISDYKSLAVIYSDVTEAASLIEDHGIENIVLQMSLCAEGEIGWLNGSDDLDALEVALSNIEEVERFFDASLDERKNQIKEMIDDIQEENPDSEHASSFFKRYAEEESDIDHLFDSL